MRSARWPLLAGSIAIACASSGMLAQLSHPLQKPRAAAQPGVRLEEFQAADADYAAGRFEDAAKRLEALKREVPNNFAVHELLGLTYGAETKTRSAVEELTAAVRLKPDSAVARTNLGVSLARVGEDAQAKAEWQKALELDPNTYLANHSLAELYLRESNVAAAQPLLRAAQAERPEAADNGYDLALADLVLGDLQESRTLAKQLQGQKDTADLHRLLGYLDEKEAKYVEAVNEFATAAHMEATEENLFAWGSELLLHRTYEPAAEIFRQGTRRYPSSSRLWIGLGMALYSRGQYETAIEALLKAADLSPADARSYQFLSKAYLSSPSQAEAVIACFRRFAALEPKDSRAQFYYAVSLWKGRRLENPDVDYPNVEALLKKSIELDESFAEAHLQLGILYNDEREYAASLPEYKRALELDPLLPDAHFRLARYYLRVGEKDKAHTELERFKQLQTQHQAELDKERAEVQQFVVASSGNSLLQP